MGGGAKKKEMKLRRGDESQEEQKGGTGVKWGGGERERKKNGSGNVAPMFRGHGPLQMIPRRTVVPLKVDRRTLQPLGGSGGSSIWMREYYEWLVLGIFEAVTGLWRVV